MRGRIPKPWFWSERDSWYVVIRGSRIALGREKKEAFRRYHELMASPPGAATEPKPTPQPTLQSTPQPALTFGGIISRYLDDLKRRVTPRTHYVAACYLQPIRRACGMVPVRELTGSHVDDAISSHGRWNPTTEHHVRCRVLAAMNWAVARDLIPANPLKGLRKPRARSRGAEAIIAADDHSKLLAAAPEYLRNVLFALQQTGARPCEVLTVTAADFDPLAGVWLLRDHKTASQTGWVRVVFLPPELVELCKSLAAKYPTGPLFRSSSGKPFPAAYYLPRLVRSLRRKLGLPESLSPYGYRHTFATDALSNGVPEAHVAELLGHSGTTMLHKHYSHLGTKAAALRAALKRVR